MEDKLKGRMKEAAGAFTGDENRKAEGRAQQSKAEAAEEAKQRENAEAQGQRTAGRPRGYPHGAVVTRRQTRETRSLAKPTDLPAGSRFCGLQCSPQNSSTPEEQRRLRRDTDAGPSPI